MGGGAANSSMLLPGDKRITVSETAAGGGRAKQGTDRTKHDSVKL